MSPQNQESDTLRSALQALGSIDFDDLPSNTDNQLYSFTHDLLAKSYDAVQCVPPPQRAAADSGPDAVSSVICGLRKEWGQPINKLDDEGSNPLRIPVYKLAASDGKGSWFARRSIHEGLPFDRWKAKFQDEFEETMRRRKRNGGCLEGGSVRGLGCERCLDSVKVPMQKGLATGNTGSEADPETKENEEGFGSIAAYHLSAVFQGPSTPRDFVTLLITSDRAVEANNAEKEDSAELGSDSQRPRSYMVVSKPCNHSDAPTRKGFIRGCYESIEFIREIPKMAEEGNGDESKGVSDAESSSSARGISILPIEWTMITRSDPGGSIPRFLVDRGTPPSMIEDARKFMEWAYEDEEAFEQPEKALSSEGGPSKSVTGPEKEDSDHAAGGNTGLTSIDEDAGTHIAGLIDGVFGLISLTMELITPRILHSYNPLIYTTDDDIANDGRNEVEPIASDTEALQQDASQNNSMSAGRESPAGSGSNGSHIDAMRQQRLRTSSTPPVMAGSELPSKELEKLARRKKQVEDDLHALHEQHRDLLNEQEGPANVPDHNNDPQGGPTPSSSTDRAEGNGETTSSNGKNNKVDANRLKKLSAIEKKEAKFESQISKINDQQEKALARAEARQNKDAQKTNRLRAKSEAGKSEEEIRRLRDEVNRLSREKAQLVEVIGKLQKENTKLVAEK